MSYAGVVFYVEEGDENYMNFAAAKKLNALIEYIESNHPQAEIDHSQSFHFSFEGDYIELKFDTPQERLNTGWTIAPHMIPCRIFKEDADNFGKPGYPFPPTCVVSVHYSPHPDTKAVRFVHYAIPLEGVTNPTTLLIDSASLKNTLKKWFDDEEGWIDLTLTRVHMVGPAGSGKTCAQNLLLNEPPPPHSESIPRTTSSNPINPHTSSDTSSSDHPILEHPSSDSHASIDPTTDIHVHYNIATPSSKYITNSTPIACKAVKALRIASNDNETWNRITRDELLERLASRLKRAAVKFSQQNQALSASDDIMTWNRITRDEQLASRLERAAAKFPQQNQALLNELGSETSVSNEEVTPEASEEPRDYRAVVKEITDHLPKAKAQLSEKWAYIIDSGGQPAFQELLPVFTRAASLNIITLNLSKGLDEKFEYMYRFNGNKFKCDENMKYSNRKVFDSVISAASVQKPLDIPYQTKPSKEDTPIHSMSFVLGTHYDVVIESSSDENEAETKVKQMSNDLMSQQDSHSKKYEEEDDEEKVFVNVPQGIFPLIIVRLLKQEECVVRLSNPDDTSDSNDPFKPNDVSQFRDAASLLISFDKSITDPHERLYIINREKHIEVIFTGKKEHCPKVNTLVRKVINDSAEDINILVEDLNVAFACQRDKSKYCIIQKEEPVCRSTPTHTCPLDDSYWCWFNTSSPERQHKSDTGISGSPQCKHRHDVKEIDGKELTIKTAMRIFVSSAHHYMLIGIGLGVIVADLKDTDEAINNLIKVFQRWFEADKDVSWNALIELCDDYPDQLGQARTKLNK
uniref:Death domain-containing protein n=1 Tax=Amphimedon queenslandica TaxID=400682 RepID=A0A1X7TN69_AMPQE